MERKIHQHAASRIGSAGTPANTLRQILKQIEIYLGKIKTSSVSDLHDLPVLFDQAADLLDDLEESGANIASEFTRFDTVCADYRKKGQQVLKKLGGKDEFIKLRASHNPDHERWWWYIDEYIAEQKGIQQKKRIRSFLITTAICGAVILIYALFLAPDKETRQRLALESDAERAVAEGSLEEAMGYLEQALAISPENEKLVVQFGVIAEISGDIERAEESYTKARAIINDEVIFLSSRSQAYLTAGMLESALQDADAAIEINPEFAYAYYQKGLAAINLDDRQMAFTALENAAKYAEKEGKIELEAMARIQLAYLQTSF